MSALFSPAMFRGVTLRNRVAVSPMCQYSSEGGMPNEWHLVHLGSRAVGGAGLVVAEATAVTPEGRISPGDTGLWSDAHRDGWRPIAEFVARQGAVPAIQLAHAGRKASTDVPWRSGRPIAASDGGWETLAPSAVAFRDGEPTPREMTAGDMSATVAAFADAARRAAEAGFRVVELHMAHGYLLHEFLSPLSNHRSDGFGGTFDGRARFPLEVARAVRATLPDDLPVFARISATDWVEGGWDLVQSIELARRLRELGIDLVDCSSGGAVPGARIPAGPGYQVPFASAIRREAGVATGAVGFIREPAEAERVIADGEADVVFIARALLRDPYWPLHAAKSLGVDVTWPVQYERARD